MPLQYDKANVANISYGGNQIVGREQPAGVEIADSLVKIASTFSEIANKADQKEQAAKGEAAIMDAAIQGKQKEVLQAAAENENKWYNKMWGPSAFYQGMQSMAAANQAQQFAAEEGERIHKSQGDGGSGHMAPDIYRAYLTKQIMSKKTGDPLVDAEIMKTMLPVAQQLGMKQAEKHAEFANVQASTDYMGSIAQAKRTYETEAQAAGLDQNARNVVLAAPLRALNATFVNKPANMQTASFLKLNSEMVAADLKDGNSVLYEMWKNSGWLDKSAPEDQRNIAEAQKDFQQTRLTGSTISMLAVMAKVDNSAENGDVNGVIANMKELQDREKVLGIKTPGVKDLAATMAEKMRHAVSTRYSMDRAAQREARDVAREAAREARAAAKLKQEIGEKMSAITQVAVGLMTGTGNSPLRDPKTGLARPPTSQEKEQGYLAIKNATAQQQGSPVTIEQSYQLSTKAGHDVKDPDIQNVVGTFAALSGQQLSQNAAQLLPKLDSLVKATGGDMTRLDRYADDKLTKYNLGLYAEFRNKKLSPEEAYSRSFGVVGTAEPSVEKKELKSAIDDMVGHFWNRGPLYQVSDLLPTLTPKIEKEAEYLSRQRPGLTAEQVVKHVAERIRTDGIDTVSGKPVLRNKPSAGRLYEQAGLSGTAQVDAAVAHIHDTVLSALRAQGKTVTDFMVDQNYAGEYVYTPVANGMPVFSRSVALTGPVIQQAWQDYVSTTPKSPFAKNVERMAPQQRKNMPTREVK
jgi:hypothetical protein